MKLSLDQKIEAIANSDLGLTARSVILTFIALSHGRVVHTSHIEGLLSQYNMFGSPTNPIRKLREAIEPKGFKINTIYSIGWQMVSPDSWSNPWPNELRSVQVSRVGQDLLREYQDRIDGGFQFYVEFNGTKVPVPNDLAKAVGLQSGEEITEPVYNLLQDLVVMLLQAKFALTR